MDGSLHGKTSTALNFSVEVSVSIVYFFRSSENPSSCLERVYLERSLRGRLLKLLLKIGQNKPGLNKLFDIIRRFCNQQIIWGTLFFLKK